MYDRFEHLLQSHGITAYKVSKETGLPTSFFAEWKKGKSKPKIDKIQKIAAFFDVPVDYFYGQPTTQGDKKSPPDESEGLSERAIEFLRLFDQLPVDKQEDLIVLAQALEARERSKQEHIEHPAGRRD